MVTMSKKVSTHGNVQTLLTKQLAFMLAIMMLFSINVMGVFADYALNPNSTALIRTLLVYDGAAIIPLDNQNTVASDVIQYFKTSAASIDGTAQKIEIDKIDAEGAKVGTKTVYYDAADTTTIESKLAEYEPDESLTDDINKDKVDQIMSDANVNPDTGSAYAILAPAMPIINTLLGALLIILITFITVFTVLDFVYIGLPAFRIFCSESANNGGVMSGRDKNGGVKIRWVSHEAQTAVEEAEKSEGYKSPWGKYLLRRLWAYIALAICIYILLTGNISIITNIALQLVGGLMDVIQGMFG